MNINNNRNNAHSEIDRVFKILLPTRNMAERPAQVALSHQMLDAMLDGGIALCDAGTGIGKTYAYLVAGTAFSRFRAASGLALRPILISTSSIALQNAVRDEYLPLLSDLLTADGIIAEPLQAVIRKGKSHYVCDERLEQRLGQLDLSKKNWRSGAALLTLRGQLDVSEAAHLSHYDRERVCVPQTCDCQRESCRYRSFLEDCDTGQYLFQICNHNLLLADAIHRSSGRRPILPDTCALIVDEAHKLPETARQMFGVTLEAEDIRSLTHGLRCEQYLLAAESLGDATASLLRKLSHPPEDRPFEYYAKSLAAPNRSLTVIRRQLHSLLTPPTRRQLETVSSTVALFHQGHPNMVFYTEEDSHGGTMLCATISDLTAQLRQTLWRQERPVILASATLAVGKDFRRFKEETGLLTDSRVAESVSLSPFDYQQNCLLYLPQTPPHQKDGAYYDKLAEEIAALLEKAQGHALALFTSYAAMSAVKERLQGQGLAYPLFTMGRSAIHTTEQFKAHPGSVLLATGAAWEGFDFPGDCVSLLIIPRLPFAVPDALKEKERENHPSLRLFIRAVVVPEMQIKLKQGFGRAIRTETDTCVVAILDERAAKGQRYRKDVLTALPRMKEGNIPFQYSRTLGYRRGPDGKPEIDPEEAETVRLIYTRYLEGRSLGDIQRELVEKNIPTAVGIQGWSRQVIQNILTSEKYIGDGLRQKTYTTGPIGNKKVVKNNGELPMYYTRDNHPAIIPRDIYYRVKEEMARRTSKRKVMQKTGKTEQGKYSAKYALSELLICGECGTPYKRCTWARNGKKRIVWRCISRLEFGTQYCHNSPTLDEDRLHRAIVASLNEYGAIRDEIKADVLELAELARSGGEGGGTSLPELRRRLEALTVEQARLLDEILEDMGSEKLNAQLQALADERQSVLDQIAACQQGEEQRAIQASRQREMEEWLDQQPMCFTEYDDTLTRRFVERITVVDAETIQVKIRDVDIVIDETIC